MKRALVFILVAVFVFGMVTDVSAIEKKTGVFPEWRKDIPRKPESRPAEIKFHKGEYWRLVIQKTWKDEQGEHLEKIWQNSAGKQWVETVL